MLRIVGAPKDAVNMPTAFMGTTKQFLALLSHIVEQTRSVECKISRIWILPAKLGLNESI